MQRHHNGWLPGVFRRVTAFPNATRKGDSQDAVESGIPPDEFVEGITEGAVRVGNRNAKELRPFPQPVEMLVPPERSAAEEAQRFKDSVSVKKSPIKNGNHRLFFRDKLTIQKNNHPMTNYPDFTDEA